MTRAIITRLQGPNGLMHWYGRWEIRMLGATRERWVAAIVTLCGVQFGPGEAEGNTDQEVTCLACLAII